MRRFSVLLALAMLLAAAPDASADTTGQTFRFNVNEGFDADGAGFTDATLRELGSRGYFYVDDRYWDALSSAQRTAFADELKKISDDFDDTIYPRSVALWGSEATPGVDGDSRVVILLQRLVAGSGGYFETINNYSRDRTTAGNAREMVYVNIEGVLSGAARRYLAHEFQHLISFNQRELLLRVEEDLWLNEGRSEYNVTAVGYSEPFGGSTLERRMLSFLRTPSDSLTGWPNTSTDYAIASMFTHYLVDRFGTGILSSTMHTTGAGAQALDDELARQQGQRFGDVFADWMVTAYLNDASVGAAYAYDATGLSALHVTPTVLGRLDSNDPQSGYSVTVQEWQPVWVSVPVRAAGSEHTAVRVRLEGSGALWRGAVVARYGDGTKTVSTFTPGYGQTERSVPVTSGGSELTEVVIAATQGSIEPLLSRDINEYDLELQASFGSLSDADAVSVSAPTTGSLKDGDLIRSQGQADIYVVWGPYRRYLNHGILELYGFQDRPVREVSDDVFFSYDASVYIRALDTKQVYAVWPDGTKHWLNITAAQWDASFRDWGAIFTVNDAEVAFYTTGPDITR